MKVKVRADVDTPFRYYLISEIGEVIETDISNSVKFELKVKCNKTYQIIIEKKMMVIFKSDEGKHTNIFVNALTTVASIFCFSQLINKYAYLKPISKCDDDHTFIRHDVAHAMMSNFITEMGIASNIIISSPNGDETNSYRLFNFIANIALDASHNHTTYKVLAHITGHKDILRALHSIALNPSDDIIPLYNLGKIVPKTYTPYIESLEQIGQFALSIKINNSGSINYLPGGPAFIVFDAHQKPWISLNTTQGTDGSNTFAMVLQPNGHPAPISPIFPVLGGAYGVAYDKFKDRVIFGSFGWGAKNYAYNPFEGSISVFDAKTGQPITPPNGYTNHLHRVQGVAVDSKGNYWMCSWGSNDALGSISNEGIDYNNFISSIVVYLNGNPDTALVYKIKLNKPKIGKSSHYAPFAIAIDSHDNAFVTCGGSGGSGGSSDIPSSVIKLSIHHNKIKKEDEYVSDDYNFYKGIAINSKDEIYVASFLEDKIIKLSNNLKYLSSYYSKNSGPWGVHVDAKNIIWVANFLPDSLPSRDFSVAQLYDDGRNISRINKFTLPSGGDPVTLATGRPLTDDQDNPITNPLMRLTYAVPDASGNLYVANNWKPSIIDDIRGDPGGDGIVIFVGIGAPRKLD